MDRITVHPRVTRRHPDIQVADVESAWRSAIAVRRRNYDPPEYYAAAGADSHGRLLEMVGVELDDGSLLIFHAMRLTDKMAQELQVRRENTGVPIRRRVEPRSLTTRSSDLVRQQNEESIPALQESSLFLQAGLDSQTRILSPLLSKCHAHIETHWTVGLRRRAKLAVSSCEKHSKEH